MKKADKIRWSFKLKPTVLDQKEKDFSKSNLDFIGENLFFGNIKFLVNDVDIGGNSLYLLDFSLSFLNTLSDIFFQKEDSEFNYSEHNIKLKIQPRKRKVNLLFFEGNELIQKTSCDSLLLASEVGKLHMSLLAKGFKKFPSLAKNYFFIINIPFAWEYLEKSEFKGVKLPPKKKKGVIYSVNK